MTALLLAVLLAEPPAAVESRITAFTVTDKEGVPIEGLTERDVVLMENGVARKITRLTADARPLTLALVVDTSQAVATSFRLNVIGALESFVRDLPQGSTVSVWATAYRPQRLVGPATSPEAVVAALKTAFTGGGNTLLDAIVEAARDLRKQEAERTALLVVTGAGPERSGITKERVVDQSLDEADVFLAVQYDDVDAGLPDRYAQEWVLDRLTHDSGGRFERPLTAMGVGSALKNLAGLVRSQYRVEYETAPELKERKLEIKVALASAQVSVGRAGRAARH
jgi:VWFA-related protein